MLAKHLTRFSSTAAGRLIRPSPLTSSPHSFRPSPLSLSCQAHRQARFASTSTAAASAANAANAANAAVEATANTAVEATAAAASTAAATATATASASSPSSLFDYIVFPVQDALHLLHAQVGLPWWASVLVATITIRTLLLPLYVSMQRNGARMRIVAPIVDKLKNEVMAKPGRTQADMLELNQRVFAIMAEHKVSPFKSFLPMLAQTPFFITFYFSLTKLSERYPEIAHSSFGWINDLSIPDPTYGLPLVVGGLFITSIEAGTDGVSKASLGNKVWLFRGMAAFSTFISSQLPAVVVSYFSFNQLVSLVLTLIMKLKPVRKVLGIPALPTPAPVAAASSAASSASSSAATNTVTKSSAQTISSAADASKAAAAPKTITPVLASVPIPSHAMTAQERSRFLKQKKAKK